MAPLTLERALDEEASAIRAARGGSPDGAPTALCLSGGGIRSASFALGLIQGLARHGLLQHFDYLSTVSGGGFAGGWLSAWLHHAAADGDRDRVFRQLRGEDLNAGAHEPLPVTHMRDYSRYMSPQLGLFSADSWALVATMLRNVVLNWLVLLPLLSAVLIAPRAYLEAIQYLDRPIQSSATMGAGSASTWLLVLSLSLLAVSVAFTVASLPSYGNRRGTQAQFLIWSLAPLAGAAFGFSLFWATDVVAPRFVWIVGTAAAINTAVWAMAGAITGSRAWRPRTWLAAALSAPVGATGLWWLMTGPFRDGVPLGPLYCTVALPLVLVFAGLQSIVFVALARNEQVDADLEWHGRQLGWVLLAALGWAVMAALVFCAPLAFRAILDFLEAKLQISRTSGAGLLGGVGSLIGAVVANLLRSRPAATSGSPTLISRLLPAIAVPAVLLFLLGALAWMNVSVMRALYGAPSLAWLRVTPGGTDLDDVTSAEVIVAAAMLLAVGAVMARLVPVNRFSLNGMYRERLMRAFLGASRSRSVRRPNPFTGFDERDNIPMQRLTNVGRPFLVVNTTLNRVAEEGLAMQFRKAEAFTITPLHAGAPRLNAFRPTAAYANEHGADGSGISLGTAISISGAAASPNMGARSSPPLTFLMTLFNARLGVWLGNPGQSGDSTWQRSEPALGVGPILSELLGRTSDRNPYVYLSDGGHFDNLGLWSMVLRRCGRIVVSDAGADPIYAFDDLANAIRLIRIDLGVPIVFDGGIPMSADPAAPGNRSFAVGRILYSAADGPGAADGVLIYVKATLAGNEPVDVRNYAASHPTFPHESTAEQWFTEAQFESYRLLGMTAAERVASASGRGELGALFQPASPTGEPQPA